MKYKEGKDFEWVPMRDKDGDIVKDGRGGTVKTRRFFTKAEKEAMKSGDKPKAKAKSKPKSSSSSSAPKKSKRPMRRTGKLNDDAKAARTNSSEKYGTGSGPRTAAPKKRTSSGLSISGRVYPKTSEVPNPEDSVKVGSLTVTPSQRLSDAGKRLDSYKVSKENKSINGVTFDEWRKLSRSERVEKNLPLTSQEFMRAMRLKGADSAPVVSKSSKDTTDDARARATRTNRSRNSPDIPGMSKGGMVKSGNKDYKKSGMFYKSGSPRGYK